MGFAFYQLCVGVCLVERTLLGSTSHAYQGSITQQKHLQSHPSVFNKLLKPPRQLELPHSSIPHPRGAPSSLGLLTQKTINTAHLLDLPLQ